MLTKKAFFENQCKFQASSVEIILNLLSSFKPKNLTFHCVNYIKASDAWLFLLP